MIMIGSETATTTAALMSKMYAGLHPPHRDDHPNEKLVTGRSNGPAYASVYATTVAVSCTKVLTPAWKTPAKQTSSLMQPPTSRCGVLLTCKLTARGN
jgi:hypothetical protein